VVERQARGFGLWLQTSRRIVLENHSSLGIRPAKPLFDARRCPRFKLEVDICVLPRTGEMVKGHSVDISESGISAMLRFEVPVGEIVRLEFPLPLGPVEVYALVRNRNAFRYGFQFVDADTLQELIRCTCRQLAMEQSLFGSELT
jgi:hypothetical protein